MATTHLDLAQPAAGAAGWKTDEDGVKDALDEVIAASKSQAVSTGTVTLSLSAAQCRVLVLTGTLTGNVNVDFPRSGEWTVVNDTVMGAFTLTLRRTGGGETVGIAEGNTLKVRADATDMTLAQPIGNVTVSTSAASGTPLNDKDLHIQVS